VEDWKIKGKPALVILHMQEAIAGSLASGPIAQEVKDSDHIPHQQALLKAFRDRNLPVIYVVFDQSKFPDWSVLGYGMMSKRPKSVFNPKMREAIPELAPRPGEPVLSNWIWGAFTNSGLEQELRSRGAETLVFVGGALNIAVFNSTVQASDLWYPVIVPEDACIPTKSANNTPEMMKVREVFLEMLTRYALVTNTQIVPSR
jgi:nicotinamidase-related amidase